MSAYVHKPLQRVTLADLQDYLDSLGGSASTRARAMTAVKSLFRFVHSLGVVRFNPAAAIRLPKPQDKLAKRILTEGNVERLLNAAEGEDRTHLRDHALLRLMYNAGLRVSEAVQLKWGDFAPDRKSAVLTVYGKGGRTRTMRISAGTWTELESMRGDVDEKGFVFPGSWRRHGKGRATHIDASAVHRIVAKYAAQAGIKGAVSPHWLRHAHASHAIHRGAPLEVVRDTLGHSSLATTSRYVHARPEVSSGDFLSV